MNDERQILGKCHEYMNCHVIIETSERALSDAILASTDGTNAAFYVPEEVEEATDSSTGEIRQLGGVTYQARFRKYRLLVYPLASIRNLYLYPYYFPYYPYYYAKPYPYNV